MKAILLSTLRKIESEMLTLERKDQSFTEKAFKSYREKHCQKMQGPFLMFSLTTLGILLFLRIFVLQFINIIHSYILPAALVILFWFFLQLNKRRSDLNFYMLTVLVPLVVLIVA